MKVKKSEHLLRSMKFVVIKQTNNEIETNPIELRRIQEQDPEHWPYQNNDVHMPDTDLESFSSKNWNTPRLHYHIKDLRDRN